jgi:hypothetical protein
MENIIMNLTRRINIWVITYASLVILVCVLTILLGYYVNNQIELVNQNPITELPVYEEFDNQIRLNSYKLFAADFDEQIYMSGYVSSIDEDNFAFVDLQMKYEYFKSVEIDSTIILSTLFGTEEGIVIDIGDFVSNNYVTITVKFNNDTLQVLQGTEVDASYYVKTHINAIIIPSTMLYVANDLSYVYVLNDNKTEYRQVFVDVKFEINSGTEVVIVGDVFVGDEIVEIR